MNNKINYNEISKKYSIHRNASSTVCNHILEEIKNIKLKNILEIGCGTADYINILNNQLKTNSYGLDNSEGMINEAKTKYSGINFSLIDFNNDNFKFKNDYFDLIYSIDAIHYSKNLSHFYNEGFRILCKNGKIITITDSEEDLKNRTLTKYFPETLDAENKRYHKVNIIIENMKNSGFKDIKITHTIQQYEINDKIFLKFKNKAYSSLRLISNSCFEKGIQSIENDMKNKKCIVNELYTYIWGSK